MLVKAAYINFKIKSVLINLLFLLFIFRGALPVFKYPFIIIYFFTILYYLFEKNKKLVSLKRFINYYILLLIILIIIFTSLIFSCKLYLVGVKDIINIIIILSLNYLLYLTIESKDNLVFQLNNLFKLIFLFALLVAFYRIYQFFHAYRIDNSQSSLDYADYIYGEFDLIDYNFSLIPIFFGFIIVIFFFKKKDSLFLKFAYNIFLFVFTFTIIISYSRRGFYALIIIFSLLVFFQIISGLIKNTFLKRINTASRFYLIFSLFFMILFYCFLKYTSYSFKNDIVGLFAKEEISTFEKRISSLLYRYFFVLNDQQYSEFHTKIWNYKISPKDPDSGWGTRIHKTIYPLTGNMSQMIPKGTKGYLMDNTCNANTWDDNAFSYTLIGNDSVKKGDKVFASVYCFASDDFNGDWIKLSSRGSTYGNKINYYDLDNKNTWQKLQIKVSCDNGIAPVYLYFSKYGVTDFNTLKGFVIFAYPTYEVIHDSSFQSNHNYHYSISNSSNMVHCNNKISDFHYLRNTSVKSSISYVIVNPLSVIFTTTDDHGIFRKNITNLFNEDTTYYSYSSDLKIHSSDNKFISARLDRWKFAWQIFTKEYTWPKKIFGGGFDYLNWYGYYFLGDKTKSDWPHNPFLSVLLYSGILGLGLYLLLLFKVFNLYLKYLKEYYILFIFFLISFFFSFFSANNPFDPPVMGFFVMLPFFIHYVHVKERKLKIED